MAPAGSARGVYARGTGWLVGLSLLAAILYLGILGRHGWFNDLAVYRRAVADVGLGLDPYRTDVRGAFVYQPLILDIFVAVDRLVPLLWLLPGLSVGAAGWFVSEAIAALPRDKRAVPVTAMALLAAAAFGGIGVKSIVTGNLTLALHFGILAAFLRTLRGGWPWLMPALLVGLAALIKPYFLLYLLLPIAAAARFRVIALRVAAIVALCGIVWVAPTRFDPVRFAAFLAALDAQSLDLGDLGYSVFGWARWVTANATVALACHAVLCGLALGAVFRRWRFRDDAPGDFLRPLSALYLALTIANPRLKEYDLFPALVPVFMLVIARGAVGPLLAGLVVSWVPLGCSLVRGAGFAVPPAFSAPAFWQIAGLLTLAGFSPRPGAHR